MQVGLELHTLQGSWKDSMRGDYISIKESNSFTGTQGR